MLRRSTAANIMAATRPLAPDIYAGREIMKLRSIGLTIALFLAMSMVWVAPGYAGHTDSPTDEVPIDGGRPGRVDGDGDGVLDQLDRCPASLPGQRPLRDGCTRGEIIRDPGIVLDPVVAGLRAREEGLRRVADYRQIAQALTRGTSLIEAAGARLSHGDSCDADRTYGRAVDALKDARSALTAQIDEQQRLLLATAEEPGGDIDRNRHDVAVLSLIEKDHLDGVGPAVELGGLFADMCSSIASETSFRGRVESTFDAQGALKLSSGETMFLTLANRGRVIAEGQTIEVGASIYDDGTITTDGIRVEDSPPAPVNLEECLTLRIAPVQPSSDHPVLHHPIAYRGIADFDHRFEMGMGLAARSLSCVDDDGGDRRYGLKITIYQPGGIVIPVADDLADGETPVPLPGTIDLAKDATIVTRVYGRSCHEIPFEGGTVTTCGPGVPQGPERQFKAIIQDTGFWAHAEYAETTFGLIDNDTVGDWAGTSVTQLTGYAGNDDNFKAYGYTFTEEGPSSVLEEIQTGEEFLIFEDERPYSHFPPGIAGAGVDHSAGLVWPHVEGENHQRDFSYAVTLPEILKDALWYCADEPDSFYKLPYKGGYPQWEYTGFQNLDDPNPTARHNWQLYAWDIGAPKGSQLLATRGGVVAKVEKNDGYNKKFWGEPWYDGPQTGNFVAIRHPDDSVAFYFHIDTDGVLVDEGQAVKRGAVVGLVGDTGNATGYHVHYEVTQQVDPFSPDPNSYISIETRYEVSTPEIPFLPCHRMRWGGEITSTQ